MNARWIGPGVRLAGLLSVLGLVAGTGLILAAERPTAPGAARTAVGLEVGQLAPDFELPLLKEETNAAGEKVARITDEKVRLSSFRGKKVVCVFMSSYT